MNYLHAKTVLLQNNPPIPFTLFAAEAVILVALAALMVSLFA